MREYSVVHPLRGYMSKILKTTRVKSQSISPRESMVLVKKKYSIALVKNGEADFIQEQQNRDSRNGVL